MTKAPLLRSLLLFLLLMTVMGVCGVQQANNDEQPLQQNSLNNSTEAIAKNLTYNVAPGSSPKTSCPYIECSQLSGSCLNCEFNESCVYGQVYNVTCTPKDRCVGDRWLQKSMVCRYCYQTEHWEHTCVQKANCNSIASPKAYYRTNCSVKDDVVCLGNRKFYKNLPCNWTGGYRWSTALALSITLGGFGADRFYLGHWQEGVGKLFSFGGLGVWTLIDVILIALHYLGPADGSLYL